MSLKSKTGFLSIGKDLYASVVVFLVALPLCLGIALASGAPLFSGLIAGIIGGIVVGSLSNSPLGVSGPAAGLAVIVLNAIQTFGNYQMFLVSLVICGIIQLALCLIRAGVIGHFFPSSVIKGMLAGIGIIIVLKQIPHAVGFDNDYLGDIAFEQPDHQNTFSELTLMLQNTSSGAIVVSVMALFIMISWDSFLSKKISVLKMLPGALVAVVAGIIYQVMIGDSPVWGISREHLVNVPVLSSDKGFSSLFTFPDFQYFFDAKVWYMGGLLAVIASLETLVSVEAIDKLDSKKRVTAKNRELMAQGVGNMMSGLIGGLPITQVIVRSSANIQSGAQSKLSAITHGFLLMLCVFLIPGVLNLIPLAVLAGVLILVGYKLAKPSLFTEMYKAGWNQFIPFIVTILGVVFTNLLTGIILGLVVAIFIILKNSYKNSHFLHIQEGNNGDKIIRMTLAEEVTFLNKGAVKNTLNELPKNSKVEIDISKSFKIDADVLEIIDDFMVTASDKNIQARLIQPNSVSDD